MAALSESHYTLIKGSFYPQSFGQQTFYLDETGRAKLLTETGGVVEVEERRSEPGAPA